MMLFRFLIGVSCSALMDLRAARLAPLWAISCPPWWAIDVRDIAELQACRTGGEAGNQLYCHPVQGDTDTFIAPWL
jgi:hypothetical protein